MCTSERMNEDERPFPAEQRGHVEDVNCATGAFMSAPDRKVDAVRHHGDPIGGQETLERRSQPVRKDDPECRAAESVTEHRANRA